MKTLIPTSAKALMLTLILLSLASGFSFAGGNNKNKTEGDNTNSTYSDSLTDLEIALAEVESVNESFEITPQVKIYDSNFNLVKASHVPSECNTEDKELLKLMRNSNVLMEFGNITYYLMNE